MKCHLSCYVRICSFLHKLVWFNFMFIVSSSLPTSVPSKQLYTVHKLLSHLSRLMNRCRFLSPRSRWPGGFQFQNWEGQCGKQGALIRAGISEGGAKVPLASVHTGGWHPLSLRETLSFPWHCSSCTVYLNVLQIQQRLLSSIFCQEAGPACPLCPPKRGQTWSQGGHVFSANGNGFSSLILSPIRMRRRC